MRRSVENPCVRYSLKKMAVQQNGRRQGLYITLGWSRDFKGLWRTLLEYYVLYWRGLFQGCKKGLRVPLSRTYLRPQATTGVSVYAYVLSCWSMVQSTKLSVWKLTFSPIYESRTLLQLLYLKFKLLYMLADSKQQNQPGFWNSSTVTLACPNILILKEENIPKTFSGYQHLYVFNYDNTQK